MFRQFKKIKSKKLDFNNAVILNSFNKFSKHVSFSHKINNRWENQYLDFDYVREVNYVFRQACHLSKDLIKNPLIVPNKGLGFDRDEFWFNIAKPGESTGWHDHLKGSILSGVYYLKVPQNSGNICFRIKQDKKWYFYEIESRENMLLLFDSKLEHSVTKNLSNQKRVSIAFNLYKLPITSLSNGGNFSKEKFYL